MTYIFCAFEAEARPIIDAYKLIKQKGEPYTLFSDENLHLIISGMGQEKAKKSAQYLLSKVSVCKDDTFINLGVCAARDSYSIGELLEIKSIHSDEVSYVLKPQSSDIKHVSCFSTREVQNKTSQTDIAEMEALGLYETLKDAFLPEKMGFFKVVSDNFRPFVPKKKFIIELMQAHTVEIQAHIKKLQGDNLVR